MKRALSKLPHDPHSVGRRHRRKPKKRGAFKNRDLATDVNRGLRDQGACLSPGKVAYATKHHAKLALKRSAQVFALTAKQHAPRAGSAVGLGRPRAYRCRCGRWHIGHLPKSVRSGPEHRDRIKDVAA